MWWHFISGLATRTLKKQLAHNDVRKEVSSVGLGVKN